MKILNWIKKHPIWSIVIFIFLLGFIGGALPDSKQKADTDQSQVKTQPTESEDPIAATVQRLQKEIEGLKNFSSKKDSSENILAEALAFSAYAGIIREARAYNDGGVNKLADDLGKRVSQLQVIEFPIMRKAYGETTNKALWIENGECKVFGDSYKTIEIISGLFASNKAIAQMQSDIEDNLIVLRFKKINYKWINSASKYSYYDIESPPDNQVVEFKPSK